MLRLHCVAVICLVVVAGLSAVCAAQPPSQTPPKPEVPEYLRYPRGMKPKIRKDPKPGEFRTTFAFPQIPRVIDIPEWAQYADTLRLSGAQRKATAEAYDQYRRADWDFRLKYTESIFERSEPFAALREMNRTLEDAVKVAAILDEAERLGEDIREIEYDFFQQVAEVLAEKQLTLLDAVRIHRERKLARMVWGQMNGYSFDLDDALYELDKEGIDLTPREPEVFEGLVQAWRTAITSAYVKHARLWNERSSERTMLSAEQVAADKAGERDRAMELRAKQTAYKESGANAATRVLEQHRQYVEQIAAQLGERSRKRLLQVFNDRMFGPLFPDPCDMTPFLDAVGDLSLSKEQQPRIAEILSAWELEADQALKNYIEIYVAWREDLFAHGYGNHNYPEYTRKMSEAIDARISRCNALIDAILEVLSDKQDRKVAEEVMVWRESIDDFRAEQEATRKRSSGWPAPTEVH